MKTLQELDLHVPHLGVKQTCQAIGGYGFGGSGWGYGRYNYGCYGWLEGSHGNYTQYYATTGDGDITPAYCIANKDSFKSHNDYFDLSSLYSAQASYYSGGGGSYSYGGAAKGISCSEDDKYNGYYYDSSIDKDDRDSVDNAMECLPEEFLNYHTLIAANSELLAMINEKANGCFLHEGQVKILKDGSRYIADHDMVLIRDIEDLSDVSLQSVLEEEFWHNWQHETCMKDIAKVTEPIKQSMEFQVEVLNCINNWVEVREDSLYDTQKTIGGILYNAMYQEGDLVSNVIDALNSITPSQWNKISEEWSNIHGFSLDTTNYDWNWEKMIHIKFDEQVLT